MQFIAALDDVDVLVSPRSPLPGALAHGADGAVRERRGRADAVLLAPGLHRLLLADRTACHFHTRRLHRRRTAHRPATRRAAFAEETLFRAAHAYEQATDWHTRIAPAAQA